MKIAFSPCPNDTFIFDAWVHAKIASTIKPEPVFADIQELNEWALAGLYPVIKVSAFTLAKITRHYKLLSSGSAISRSGPKIIAKEPFTLAELGKKRLAVPGLHTTAHLLFSALCPKPMSIIACRYDEITKLIESGIVDAGLIIHETRFTFQRAGFCEIADLGELFYARYGLPVPLGVIVAKRELGCEVHCTIEDAIKASLSYAWQNRASSQKYILENSQEKEPAVIQKHIEAYVTQESLQISPVGHQAIKTLFELGIKQNLLPEEALNFA